MRTISGLSIALLLQPFWFELLRHQKFIASEIQHDLCSLSSWCLGRLWAVEGTGHQLCWNMQGFSLCSVNSSRKCWYRWFVQVLTANFMQNAVLMLCSNTEEVWVLRAKAAEAALAGDATAGGNATAPRKPMVLKQGVLCTKKVLASLSQPLWDCVDRICLEHVKDDFTGQK